jgi:hypothetical protein
MSDGHTGFSLPSLVEDSVKTNSTSSGPPTQERKRPCGPTALYVGPGTENVAPRALFYNISQHDTEDEESEDQSRRGRRRRSTSTRNRADPSSSAAAAAESSGSTRAFSRPAAVSTGSTGAGGTASLPPGGLLVTSFGEAVLRGVAQQEALLAAVTFGAGPSFTGTSAVASSGFTGASESAGGGSASAGAVVAAGLPAAGTLFNFGDDGAGDRPVDQFTTPVRPAAEPRCRYELEAEVMTREYNDESQAVFRARLEYNELNVTRNAQLADAVREVAAARDRTGVAEAHAQRSQTAVEQATQRMIISRRSTRSVFAAKRCTPSGRRLNPCMRRVSHQGRGSSPNRSSSSDWRRKPYCRGTTSGRPNLRGIAFLLQHLKVLNQQGLPRWTSSTQISGLPWPTRRGLPTKAPSRSRPRVCESVRLPITP